MTARQHIIALLSQTTGYVPSSAIHDYVCQRLSINRNGSHTSLRRMCDRGVIVRRGTGPHSLCRLADKSHVSSVRLFDQLRGVGV